MIGNQLHAPVGKLDGRVAGVRNAQHVKRILEPHQTESNGPVPEVGGSCFRRRIEIDVDDVIEHPHPRAHGAAQQRFIQIPVLDVRRDVDRTKIADGGFVF